MRGMAKATGLLAALAFLPALAMASAAAQDMCSDAFAPLTRRL